MKTFAKRLKKAREAAGYVSAQMFAEKLGMEPHSYRKYERGQSEPNFEMLVRICEHLKVSTSYLLPVDADDEDDQHAGVDAPSLALQKLVVVS